MHWRYLALCSYILFSTLLWKSKEKWWFPIFHRHRVIISPTFWIPKKKIQPIFVKMDRTFWWFYKISPTWRKNWIRQLVGFYLKIGSNGPVWKEMIGQNEVPLFSPLGLNLSKSKQLEILATGIRFINSIYTKKISLSSYTINKHVYCIKLSPVD